MVEGRERRRLPGELANYSRKLFSKLPLGAPEGRRIDTGTGAACVAGLY